MHAPCVGLGFRDENGTGRALWSTVASGWWAASRYRLRPSVEGRHEQEEISRLALLT
jgi:hypothetical protein